MAISTANQIYRYAYVKNEGKNEYKETVNGVDYCIKPGEKIKLRRREAIALRGQFPGDKVEKKLTMTPCFDEEVKK